MHRTTSSNYIYIYQDHIKLTLDILRLEVKSKKRGLGKIYGRFKTYTRYSEVWSKGQKKRVLGKITENSKPTLDILRFEVKSKNKNISLVCTKFF